MASRVGKTYNLRALWPTSWVAAGLLSLAGCGSPPPAEPPPGAKEPEAPPTVELGAPTNEPGGAGTNKTGE
jgi:predicted small lipoprotein YifL